MPKSNFLECAMLLIFVYNQQLLEGLSTLLIHILDTSPLNALAQSSTNVHLVPLFLLNSCSSFASIIRINF